MARNNLTWIKGITTVDICFDILCLIMKDVQYLCFYLMIKGCSSWGRRGQGAVNLWLRPTVS